MDTNRRLDDGLHRTVIYTSQRKQKRALRTQVFFLEESFYSKKEGGPRGLEVPWRKGDKKQGGRILELEFRSEC